MRRIALALAIALLSPLVMGAGSGDSVFPGLRHLDLSSKDREALDAVSAYLNSIVTLKGGFVQIEPDGNVAEGTVYISKPGKMRFAYNPPSPTLIVSDGLERGDPTALADAVVRLSRRAWRLSWLTPLAVVKDFRPRTEALVDHEQIYAAIAGRNPNEARRAMRLHLRHVEEHLTSDDAAIPPEGGGRKANVDAEEGVPTI